jgi:hypothetical protein
MRRNRGKVPPLSHTVIPGSTLRVAPE